MSVILSVVAGTIRMMSVGGNMMRGVSGITAVGRMGVRAVILARLILEPVLETAMPIQARVNETRAALGHVERYW